MSNASDRPPFGPAPAPSAAAVRLSVIVPVYNERYLVARARWPRVLAVEDPAISELEVVVVDDGSTDGTREILRELAAERAAPPLPRARDATRARAPPSAPASPPPPATSSSSRTPTSSTTRATIARLIRPFLEDGADVVYGSRFLAAASAGGCCDYRHTLGNRFLTWAEQPVHRPRPDRHGDLLQGLPHRAPEVDPAALERLRARARDHRQDRQARLPDLRGARSATSAAPTSRARRSAGATASRRCATMLRYWLIDDALRRGRVRLAHPHQPREGPALQPLDGRRGALRTSAPGCSRSAPASATSPSGCCRATPGWRATSTPTTSTTCATSRAAKPYLAVRAVDVEDAARTSPPCADASTPCSASTCSSTSAIPLRGAAQHALGARSRRDGWCSTSRTASSLYSSLDEVLGHRCRYDRAMLERELAATGFELVEGTLLQPRRGARLVVERQGPAAAFTSAACSSSSSTSRVPLLRRVDRFLPWNGLGLVAVARRVEAPPG